jgi:cytochrome c-type biogenesis protein CcmH/NrfG
VQHVPGILDAFKKGESRLLRSLSDKIMVDGFVQKNKDLIRLAVITHALSKIMDKEYYKRDRNYWKGFSKKLKELLKELSEGKENMEEVEKTIIELDKHFGRYKEDIIHHSRIRRGSTLYAWGMSLTLAAKMVDVPEYELMKQSGKTKIVDEEGQGKTISERLKDAEDSL